MKHHPFWNEPTGEEVDPDPDLAEPEDDEETDPRDNHIACTCCGNLLEPPPGEAWPCALLEVCYACSETGDAIDSIELLTTEEGEAIYPPLFLCMRPDCADYFVDQLTAKVQEISDHAVFPPPGTTCTCDTCGSPIVHHDNLVRLRWGVIDTSPRTGVLRVQARPRDNGEEELLLCLPCVLLATGAVPLGEEIEEFGLWDELAQTDECVDCTYGRCGAHRDEPCECTCHVDDDEE